MKMRQIGGRLGSRWHVYDWVAALAALLLVGLVAPEATGKFSMPSYAAAEPMREDATLRAVAFRNAHNGVAVGERGTILRTENGGVTWLPCESHVDDALNDVVWVSDRRVVAVGGSYDLITQVSRAAILMSDDAGASWRRVVDADVARLHRVVADPSGSTLVAAGDWSPISLSEQYSSRDGGLTWTVDDDLANVGSGVVEPTANQLLQWVGSTGATAPVRAACRVLQDLVWVVGDHGIILHSSDAGRHWTVQRGEGRQTAVVVVVNNLDEVPWSLIGSESLESGHRVSVVILAQETLNRPELTRPRDIDFARQAASSLGAAGVDVAPASEATLWLATHRPSVVVLDQGISSTDQDQISDAALMHGVQRVVVCSREGGGGETRLHRSAMLPRCGVLAGDLWRDALNLISPESGVPASLSLKRVYDTVGVSLRGESVTTGISLTVGHRLASERPPASRRQLQIIQARLSESQRIEQAIAASRTDGDLALSLGTLLDQSANDDRLRLAWSIYSDALASGDPVVQRAILPLIAERRQFGSAAGFAELRLSAIQSSQEWRQLRRDKSFSPSGLVRVDAAGRRSSGESLSAESVAISPFQTQPTTPASALIHGTPGSSDSRVVMASATSPLVVPSAKPFDATAVAASSLRELNLPRSSLKKVNRVADVDLAWEYHPLVVVTRDALRRHASADRLQNVDDANGNLQRLEQSVFAAAWTQLAGAPVLRASYTSTTPHLDGTLSEGCWSTAATRVGDVDLRLAHDKQFLYMSAVVASERMRESSPPAGDARTIRDNDLTHLNRLAIAFDVDRDLMTAFRLETTPGRLTRDTVDGQTDWQPTWYVAYAKDDTTVTFELAFLLSDLVPYSVTPGDSWFCQMDCLAAGTPSVIATLTNPTRWVRFSFD